MVEKDAVRRAYDELAERYAEERPADGPGMAVLDAFLGPLPDEPRVLDAGCGQGAPVLPRLGESGSAIGLDASREQLGLAAESAPGAALLQGDMTRLPVARETLDAVVAYWSLIHVPLAEHGAVLEEFARLLRPGGRALVCEGAGGWTGRNPDWLDTGVGMAWEMAGAEATREGLQDAGFTVVDEWSVPEPLTPDGGEAGGDDEDESDADGGDGEPDHPWRFLAARLDGSA